MFGTAWNLPDITVFDDFCSFPGAQIANEMSNIVKCKQFGSWFVYHLSLITWISGSKDIMAAPDSRIDQNDSKVCDKWTFFSSWPCKDMSKLNEKPILGFSWKTRRLQQQSWHQKPHSFPWILLHCHMLPWPRQPLGPFKCRRRRRRLPRASSCLQSRGTLEANG